jgi:type I restriction enzyme R subunit
MTHASHTEAAFETLIVSELTKRGWLHPDRAAFDAKTALARTELLQFLSATQAKSLAALDKLLGSKRDETILSALRAQLDSRGTIDVLREGLTVHGTKLKLAYFAAAHGLNPSYEALYAANRLAVLQQVHHDPLRPSESIDLVFLLNGLPFATCELKNELTGSTVHDAIEQYRQRDPAAPIFAWKSSAIVHFAVDSALVYMSTRIEGAKTGFLPWNQGDDGCAGNPPRADGHSTQYLWEELWARDSMLDLLQRFAHLERKPRTVDKTSVFVESLIWPRYHQIDAVRKLTAAARDEGPGHRYLVQHSAGSGKSNTIAWLAYHLVTLHRADDSKVFDGVVVVTDRRVLDGQLQQTIAQFQQKHGLLAAIDEDSEQLAKALAAGTAIIVTTLQKFAFVTQKLSKLPERRYALILDEAHSSQGGEHSRAMTAALSAKSLDDIARDEERAAHEGDVEEWIARHADARHLPKNVSVFAFTATPKDKTLFVFGREGVDGKPRAFHLYSMRQAIEEGFILDVLANYTTYKAYYELVSKALADRNVPKNEALKAVGRYMAIHPHNIAQKTVVMVEHYRERVRHLIGGKAKAMVVTSSRVAAVRYKQAFDRYLKDRGYSNIGVFVAFSGSVRDPDAPEVEYTEPKMNADASGKPLPEAALPARFDEDDANLLIVANKYQTGFDQPKLHTMYVDKRLDGVQAVQTLSRLNRVHPGKEQPFVLDFANEAEAIVEAFAPYYTRTEVARGAPDFNVLYGLQTAIMTRGVIVGADVDNFCKVFFAPAKGREERDHAELHRHLRPAVDRFGVLDEAAQAEFREALTKFEATYALLAQLVPFSDAELEKLQAYSKMLDRLLPRDPRKAPVEIEGDVQLKHYRLQKTAEQQLRVAESVPLRGFSDPALRKAIDEEVPLSAVIARFNERFGTDFTDADALMLDSVAAALHADESVRTSAMANTPENFALALRPKLEGALLKRHDDYGAFVDRALSDEAFFSTLLELLGKRVYTAARTLRSNDGGERPERTVDVRTLMEVSALRNTLEPKLRKAVRQILRAHLGDKWIEPVVQSLPEEQRRALIGVDAEKILAEHLYLTNLLALVRREWSKVFSKAFGAGPKENRLSIEQMVVLLDYVNAHREDAHGKPVSETEVATLKIAVTALERALDAFLSAA